MDLVDIDQVLDNLELREAADENSKIILSRSSFPNASDVNVKEVLPNSNGIKVTASHQDPTLNAALTASPISNSSSNSYSKSFVGVSQVFNSLDDYRKNVESLESAAVRKYDEDCKLISNTSPEATNTNAVLPTNSNVSSNDIEHVGFQQMNTKVPNRLVSQLQTYAGHSDDEYDDDDNDDDDDDDGDGDEEEDEDEDVASNDIHKFTERSSAKSNRMNNDDNEAEDLTNTVTSDSLTTSSSSTFSSGPSPGFVSTTEEQSTPLSPEEVKASYDVKENIENIQPADMAVTESQTNGKVRSEGPLPTVEATSHVGLDDLAVSLSSISINSANTQSDFPHEATSISSVVGGLLDELTTSDLVREITASSALGGVLNELSATATTSMISQMRDNEKQNQNTAQPMTELSPSVSYPECDSIKDQQSKHNCDVGKEEPALPATNIKLTSNEPLPQKFQQPITFGSTMDEISDTELDSMLQEMDIDDVGDDPIKENTVINRHNVREEIQEREAELQFEPQNMSDVVDEMEGAVSCADQMNADSFSQASTVEFSEIKPQQHTQIVGNELGQSINSIASSYSSSESSLEADISGADRDDLTQKRPKRPTTLDLPAIKMNMYSNAGQTPPGINLSQSDAEPESLEDAPPGGEGQSNDSAVRLLTESNDVNTLQGEFSGANENIQQNVESDSVPDTDEDIAATGNTVDEYGGSSNIAEATGYSDPHANLGKIPPIWVPDNMATACMQCHVKFTMIKRRHHCRACGKVLCSVCCSQKFKLEFLTNPESRVCVQCFLILTNRQQSGVNASSTLATGEESAIGGADSISSHILSAAAVTSTPRSPNPNNPMEYCSTIPPHRQVTNTAVNPPTVIVPVGVLKKDGSHSSTSSNSSNKKGRKRKSVMFSDGIAPGSDLACMENQWSEAKHARRNQQNDRQRSGNSNKAHTQARTDSAVDANTMGMVAQLFRGSIPPTAAAAVVSVAQSAQSNSKGSGEPKITTGNTKTALKTTTTPPRVKKLPPSGCDEHGCFIPKGENCLPPIYVTKGDNNCEFDYKEVPNNFDLIERLQRETLKFAVQKNFFIFVKIVNLKCCMNKTVINFTTCGMHQIGNDEVIILLEYEPPLNKAEMTECPIPKDIFTHLNEIYMEAEKCNPIAELSFTMPQQSNFLGSREYGGFLYIRATFQCLQDVVMPESPFLIGVLIHRYEVPWAKVFPLRLMLRLGAQYRYYPCPHISIRERESVYAEIAQTIINLLADFRNYSYTLPSIKGMYIHMEDRQTSVLIPRNRYDDVIKAINNSSDHILAFGGNFSKAADGHLVCMQNTKDEHSEMYSYSTQAINIQGQPRKVTGASFFVLNEALKSTSGLSGKCSIVEDGLMVQILPSKMEEVRNALKNTKDIDIVCGPIDADEQQTEIVSIKWVENDRDFGIGVKSPIDAMSLEGVSGMRVHASFNYSNANYSIRLSEIYMIKCTDWSNQTQSHDITRISEQIARSTSVALLPFLDLLAANGNLKIGLRATLHQENVCYEAGTRSTKLPPLYMNALDNHLIPTLHNESNGIEDAIILELIFYILNV